MFKIALENNPSYFLYYFGVGTALLYLNRPEEAMEYFEKGRELEPNYPAGNQLIKMAEKKLNQK